MRPSTIWFALAIAWALDTLLALFHRNWLQVALTALVACAFLSIGLVYKSRERRRPPIQRNRQGLEEGESRIDREHR
jgi:membrane protein implicated in regulation of membrane protease activity